jgi:hypothetical protein
MGTSDRDGIAHLTLDETAFGIAPASCSVLEADAFGRIRAAQDHQPLG